MSTVVKPNTAVLTKEQVRRGLETHEITPNYLKHGFTRFNLAAIGADSESINDISILSSYKNLQDLNLSNAKIQSLAPLKYLHTLHSVDASNNEITEVLDFETPDGSVLDTAWTDGECYIGSNLIKANLSNNRIFKIRDLSCFKSLTHLDLSNNRIQEIGSNLLQLEKIVTLNLSNNNLKMCDGIPQLVQNLDLSANALTELSPLSNLIDLKTINVDKNRLTSLDELSECPFLQEVSAKSNWFTTFDVVSSLQSLEQLHSISLKGNPIELQLSHYRARIILRLQGICRLDSVKVTATEKVKARVCVGEETNSRRNVHAKFLPLDLFYDTVPPFNEEEELNANSPRENIMEASKQLVDNVVTDALSPTNL
eukprot:g2235.t1